MFEHLNPDYRKPPRVVILGASGFIGNAVASCVERGGVQVVRITRSEVDLSGPNAGSQLAAVLEPGDALVAAAARAPCKNADMLIENLVMARAIVLALSEVPPSHVVSISSDAVYLDSVEPLSEMSCASPETLHGAMHLAREVLFRNELRAPLATLRPSLVYGASDPHNGYGPNRFRRQAARGEDIVLFGEGEERRDHVYIDDVAELVRRTLWRRSVGVLNIATGEVHSFREIAGRVAALARRHVAVKGSPRSGPMPHRGYRPFDISACRRAFPDFSYTPLEKGLARAQREMTEQC